MHAPRVPGTPGAGFPPRPLAAGALLLAVASFGMPAIGQAQPPNPEAAAGASPETVPSEAARRARVVAVVGDARITVGDIEDAIAEQAPFLRARYRDPATLRRFVDDMVRFRLLLAEARRRGYAEHSVVVRARKRHSVQRLVRRRFDERLRPRDIPEAEIRAYYEAHRDEFRHPELRRASHILLASREEAEKLLAELRKKDLAAFRKAAREKSLDEETRLRGGDLRFFTRQGKRPRSPEAPVHPALVQAAFAQAERGQFVDAPIAVDDKWSILVLTAIRPAIEQPYPEAAEIIRRNLWRQRREEAIEAFVAKLRERFRPEVHEELLRRIRLDPPDPRQDTATRFVPRKRGAAPGSGGPPPPGHPRRPHAD